MWRKLPITALTPFTFQDYPERTACILWFSGCNMACAYCHNPELVKGKLRRLAPDRIERFLEARRGRLDGVVLSGGECTLCPALPDLARHLKSMGFLVKLDTNGTRPERLAALLDEGLVDFVALDFKAPRAKFAAITGWDGWRAFRRALDLVTRTAVAREVRTTVHADLLDRRDIDAIIRELEDVGYRGRYVLQNFRAGPTLGGLRGPSRRLDIDNLSGHGLDIEFRNFDGA